ncbi:MAG: glycine betaine ABC transporter substrate-binding protein [Hespellia sp.]|nr:glycine betaine ABC transporter substrate-binding protein [Hespellia sp.]
MLKEMIDLIIGRKEFFLNLLWEHFYISFSSIVIASVIGITLGIVISEYRGSSKIILGVINFIYTIPSIALLGILIPFSGIGNVTAMIALSIYALLPMVRNTFTGITNVDERVIEAARGMGSTRFQILYKIKIPIALPVIMSGFRNMVTMTIALAGIASFIGAGGLGTAIYRGITTNNTAMTLTGSLMIAILALVVDGMLGFFEKMSGRRNRKKRKVRIILCGGMIALLIIGIAGNMIRSNQNSEKIVRIATKPVTEQYIIGEILKEIIEQDTDITVELTQGIGGGTSNIMPGMQSGEFDMYPEYTCTGWNLVLGHTGVYDESMYSKLRKEYEESYDFTWKGQMGFSNAYALAVSKEVAEKYGLKTCSDLQKVSGQLVFGAEYDFFERPDGYGKMCEIYGFTFKNVRDVDIGLKYQAVNEGKIDVMDVFTTDGQLSKAQVVILEDDKGYFSSAKEGIVIRREVLQKYPELETVFKKLENTVDNEAMAEMNYQVEEGKKDTKDVAHTFLLEKGLLKGAEE